MTDTYKFPNGNDVVMVRKEDIVDCITNNIIDKEVALAIIKQCEVDAISILRDGGWAGIPFFGNIKINEIKHIEKTEEYVKKIEAARAIAPSVKDYVLFRKNLAFDIKKQIKRNTYYECLLSFAINKNKAKYKKLVAKLGVQRANIYTLCNRKLTVIPSEEELMLQYENNND